jgi:excisionase family DNA binding protein
VKLSEYVTTKTAARLLHCSRWTVRRMIVEGELPGAFKAGKRSWVVPRAVVLARRERAPSAPSAPSAR